VREASVDGSQGTPQFRMEIRKAEMK